MKLLLSILLLGAFANANEFIPYNNTFFLPLDYKNLTVQSLLPAKVAVSKTVVPRPCQYDEEGTVCETTKYTYANGYNVSLTYRSSSEETDLNLPVTITAVLPEDALSPEKRAALPIPGFFGRNVKANRAFAAANLELVVEEYLETVQTVDYAKSIPCVTRAGDDGPTYCAIVYKNVDVLRKILTVNVKN